MYQMMLRARNKKGFTLVEVIVVLVILAILAALLIPSMVGWITKAQDKSAIVEARSALLAMQTIVSEKYKTYVGQSTAVTAMAAGDITEALELAELDGTGAAVTATTLDEGKITDFTFTSSDGRTVTYDSTPAANAEKFTLS